MAMMQRRVCVAGIAAVVVAPLAAAAQQAEDGRNNSLRSEPWRAVQRAAFAAITERHRHAI